MINYDLLLLMWPSMNQAPQAQSCGCTLNHLVHT